jgi:hypothetical protein
VQGVQVLLEPPRSELRYVFERPWLLEEMRGLGDDLQGFLTAELDIGCLVQVDHCGITPTDKEQSRCDHMRQCRTSEIWSPTA